tara:strand:- start:341 stop:571 length:231 start_codon:yes stop_codon:yes gene_type:complete
MDNLYLTGLLGCIGTGVFLAYNNKNTLRSVDYNALYNNNKTYILGSSILLGGSAFLYTLNKYNNFNFNTKTLTIKY